ncbi:MAG TPA: hypothetical protein VGM01_03910 [Ktedonobacteraceae bacterium]
MRHPALLSVATLLARARSVVTGLTRVAGATTTHARSVATLRAWHGKHVVGTLVRHFSKQCLIVPGYSLL